MATAKINAMCQNQCQTPDARRQTPDARRQTPDARRQTPDARRRSSITGRIHLA
ncbi:hypothetical protein [Kistimonas scapharcae]|uniref:hypothetical protein n=1 Tax=Kistimonas scapharcae TaxID=1036133 RepID=UPI0031EB6AB5